MSLRLFSLSTSTHTDLHTPGEGQCAKVNAQAAASKGNFRTIKVTIGDHDQLNEIRGLVSSRTLSACTIKREMACR